MNIFFSALLFLSRFTFISSGSFNIDLKAYSRKGDAISFSKLTIYIIDIAYLYIQVIAMFICMVPVNWKYQY